MNKWETFWRGIIILLFIAVVALVSFIPIKLIYEDATMTEEKWVAIDKSHISSLIPRSQVEQIQPPEGPFELNTWGLYYKATNPETTYYIKVRDGFGRRYYIYKARPFGLGYQQVKL